VLTVADLDTGAVASADIVPGAVEPVPDPAGADRWHLDLLPVLRGLAGKVGVADPRLLGSPHEPVTRVTVALPRGWRPELPAAERWALVADGIAAWSNTPWWVHTGHSRPVPPVDPGAALARLCRLAELLLLDLVVEARRVGGVLGWHVRYELPGGGVPDVVPGSSPDLPTAVTVTGPADALRDLAWRGRDAPARYPCAPAAPPVAPQVDVGHLERGILARCTDDAGAQAVWRDGRWWHVGLRAGPPREIVYERETGQVLRHVTTGLVRAEQPPDPSWWGPPVPGVGCPSCPAESPVARPSCRTCGDTRRLHDGAVVTVTDLDERAVHLSWPDGPDRHDCTRPRRHTLTAQAAHFGVRPEELTDTDTGRPVHPGLVRGDDPDRPLRERLRAATRGRAAARIIVLATGEDGACDLSALIRLATGLGTTVHLTVRHCPTTCTDSWTVGIRPPGTPPAEPPDPGLPTLRLAVARCREHLEVELARTTPTNPDHPLPVPQHPTAVTVQDPVPALLRQARATAGTPVTTVIG
jgi:hypothetical protein